MTEQLAGNQAFWIKDIQKSINDMGLDYELEEHGLLDEETYQAIKLITKAVAEASRLAKERSK